MIGRFLLLEVGKPCTELVHNPGLAVTGAEPMPLAFVKVWRT